MNRLVPALHDWLSSLTEEGRTRLGHRRREEIEAYLANDRQEITLVLAEIAGYHLRLADLARRRAVAEHPGLAPKVQVVMDRLNDTINNEVRGFARCRPEVWS